MKKSIVRIAVVLTTIGLDYDDRVRKEILSIKKIFPRFEFKIFAVVPDNRSETGITSYGIPYELLRLKSRERYKSGTRLLVKSWDFYNTARPRLKEFDYIWCADVQTFLTVLFCRQPVLWDLHELPLSFMSNRIMRMAFNLISLKPRVMVHANDSRIAYLKKIGMCWNPGKHEFLRNFPSFSETSLKPDELFNNFKNWLGKDRCVYLQSLVDDERAAFECVSAVMRIKGMKAVVVGKFNSEILQALKDEYHDELNERVFFTGMVKQQHTPLYIQSCFCSLVYYKNVSPNNWFCEANRFYQNIVCGNPVIVGANPSMKSLVEKYGLGIATETDGGDIEEIAAAISKVQDNCDEYRQNVALNKRHFDWDSQNEKIQSIINKFIK